jgi:hypothetical protein
VPGCLSLVLIIPVSLGSLHWPETDPRHDHADRARLADYLNRVGDGGSAESLAGAVLEDELADGDAVVKAVETVLSIRGAEAVPRVLLAVDRWSERSNGRKCGMWAGC